MLTHFFNLEAGISYNIWHDLTIPENVFGGVIDKNIQRN